MGQAVKQFVKVEQKPDILHRDSVLTCLLAYSPGHHS